MISHHPNDSLLQAYATGHLEEPLALLVATHTALCPACRRHVNNAESLAGALLDGIVPAPLADESLDSVLALLDRPEVSTKPAASGLFGEEGDMTLPQPLRGYLGSRLSDLPWRQRGAIADVFLFPERKDFTTKLLRIRKGASIPLHRHEGAEVTIVLAGSYSDAHGAYKCGDVAIADQSIVHRPIADHSEDCVCLTITDAPIKLAGSIGRWLNFFVRY